MSKGISLHIGLNAVDPAHYQGWDGELNACENDAKDMAAVAKSLGYAPTLMLTKEATASTVIAAITNAAKSLKAGDHFLLTYSGHGGQVPDRNGDEATQSAGEMGEWPDRFDETWVLYDRQLVDDELWAMWAAFESKVLVEMFSDSCHSGTVAKPMPWANTEKAVARRMPLDVEERTYKAHKELYDSIQAKVPSRKSADVKASIGLISGCQDNQTSADGPVNGRFTGRFLEVWDGGRFKRSIRRLHKAIVAGMPRDQTPNLYFVGATSRALMTSPALRL
ncbi:MAG TPA: caspase family protein [Myxococcaceae bacterium]|jgi:hypothetical protein